MYYMNILSKITQKLLCNPINYVASRTAAYELHQFYYAQSGFEENDENIQHIETNTGLAVSPYSASFCTIDFLRTRNFILGLKMAIEDCLLKEPSKPVMICYAGIGPFASLVVPLTTIFRAHQIQFLLLEINETSIGYLNKLIRNIAIDDYVKEVVKVDAAEYILPYSIDILLSETMKPGLVNEPQVSIVNNIIKQCSSLPILIPQRIEVGLSFSKFDIELGSVNQKVSELLEFDVSVADGFPLNKDLIFSGGKEIVFSEPPNRFSDIVLDTNVTLYKTVRLGFNETSLTVNHKIMATKGLTFPCKYNVRYEMNKRPRFVFTSI